MAGPMARSRKYALRPHFQFANQANGKRSMDHLSFTGYARRPPHLVAIDKGFYASQDLEVEYHFVGLAPDHNREMAEGRWDMTMSSADTMLARTTTDKVDFVLFLQADEGLRSSSSPSRSSPLSRICAAGCSPPIRSIPTSI